MWLEKARSIQEEVEEYISLRTESERKALHINHCSYYDAAGRRLAWELSKLMNHHETVSV